MKVLITVIATIAALIVLGLAVIFLGINDVSAAKPEKGLMRWMLSTAMDHSVERRAKGIEVPPLGDSSQVAMGFEHYDEMCVTCHGAPDIDRSEIGKGLNPHAPNLSRSITDMSDAELYWIIKNGIKMTGMPAFGKTHTEDELWAIVAFVRLLPEMSPEQYKLYESAHEEDEGMEAEEHEHNHHDD